MLGEMANMQGNSIGRHGTSFPSLVPDKPGVTPDYWCTWGAQNYLYGQGSAALDIAELEGAAGYRHAKDEGGCRLGRRQFFSRSRCLFAI